jgi:peptidyl-prolyl cis-trans isomerase B (cyclophilin B)
VGGGRDDNPQKLTAGCQFYIVQRKEGIPRLDGKYVIFGQVFKGLEVIEKIAAIQVDTLDAPLQPLPIDVNIIKLSRRQLANHGWVAR